MNPAPGEGNKLTNAIIIAISTFFYIGYLPFIPGTFGSLAGLGLFYLMKNNGLNLAVLTFVVTILGFLVAGRAEEILKIKDCRYIVIDEISGMFLSLIFLPYDIKVVLA
ncbi:MAG: phosphatidylglycerophosphatase A, partial [Candidatus Omnitrophica bacterium]|nr:phosphatidylglycerophosphatase A [Candidatus Omnitrophota bacterium]